MQTYVNSLYQWEPSHYLFVDSLQGDTVDCDVTYDSDGRPVGDRELFAIMRGAMKVLNFSSDDESNIYRIMAIVLHLGNIQFGGTYVIKAINIEKGPRASCSNFLRGKRNFSEISQT